MVIADAACGVAAAALGSWLGVGSSPPLHQLFLVIVPLLWVTALWLGNAYDQRVLWDGPEEFHRVVLVAAMLLFTVGAASWVLRLQLAPSTVVVTLSLAATLTLALRYVHRAWLHRQGGRGRSFQTTLLVGHRNGVATLHDQLSRVEEHGYRVIGCCLPSTEDCTFHDLPVLGGLEEVVEVVSRYEIDAVAVLPTPELHDAALRRLGWDLADSRAELLLAPALTEFAGPFVDVCPTYWLPLMQVEVPELRGLRRLVKEAFDRSAALVGLLLMLPALLAIAVLVKVTSAGPVLVREERVGLNGHLFGLLRFRAFVDDADRRLGDDGTAVLVRRQEPRTTPVGRMLRKYSLDELPQLLNVVLGDMSLVGPRPPLAGEVERLGMDVRGQSPVKPGLTGLWHVSGRCHLSWPDARRMELRYLQSWSFGLDLVILAKSLGSVLRRRADSETS